jgi:RsiW-degrading membrane proteinase PrsW (M82 family)
MEKSEEPRQPD